MNSDGTVNNSVLLSGGIWDSIVYWDPNADRSRLVQDSPGSQVYEKRASSALLLAHELIHSYNLARGEIGSGGTRLPREIVVGNTHYLDFAFAAEQRAVGLAFNSTGDITENDIRAQLGEPRTVAYSRRSEWKFLYFHNPVPIPPRR